MRVNVGAPRFTEEKFRLYLKHKKRFPSLQQDVEDLENFKLSFYDESPFGIEFEYYDGGQLIGAALADCTKQTLSAVYTFYDVPDSRMSLGTFSILKQLEFSKERGIKYFYLGYFMLSNQSLRYKAAFKPNEVYIDGKWMPYNIPKLGALIPEEMLEWKNAEPLVKEVVPSEKRA